jgi:hypothetical protein
MNERTILNAMHEVLRQGELLLSLLDDVAYSTRLPAAFNSSVGGHYRHCLDHFRSVFEGLDGAEVNYDDRQRNPLIETVREVALNETQDLLRAGEELGKWSLGCAVRVRSKVSYAIEQPPSAVSSVGREIMFCIVHAIHHYALIRVMCGMLGAPVPEGFGIAPSTIKHLESATPTVSRRFASRQIPASTLQLQAG